MVKKAQR